MVEVDSSLVEEIAHYFDLSEVQQGLLVQGIACIYGYREEDQLLRKDILSKLEREPLVRGALLVYFARNPLQSEDCQLAS